MWVLCVVLFLAGCALGFFVRSRMKPTPEMLKRQLGRLDGDELRLMTETLERTWGVNATAPPIDPEEKS